MNYEINPSHLRMDENFAMFWRGPLSQWWASKFTVDGVEYNCAEQYMMAMKAKLFGDHATLEKIMNARGPWNTQGEFNAYPRDQKEFGRRVENFEFAKWDAVNMDIVFRANAARYQNDEQFWEMLRHTGDRLIVEASPYDTVWGIGLDVDHPDAFNKVAWRGENRLGRVLTSVRDCFV